MIWSTEVLLKALKAGKVLILPTPSPGQCGSVCL